MNFPGNPQKNFADKSISGMSNVLAFTTAVVGAPPLYGLTSPHVVPMLAKYYGWEFVDLFDFLWMILTFLLVFYPARAFFYFALTALASGVLYRLV